MLSCDILRHRGDRPLRRAIGDADIVTAQARARAHVDDRTSATRNHVRQGVAAGEQIAFEIDVHRHVPEIKRRLDCVNILARSEEHTSELQSLMRTSYAVICLNKKTNKITNN